MALISPFNKNKKKTTAIDALAPTTQTNASPYPPPPTRPQVYPNQPKQPTTAQTALAGPPPNSPTPTVPEAPTVTNPDVPPLPPKPVVPTPHPAPTPTPTDTAQSGSYMAQEQQKIKDQMDSVNAALTQMRERFKDPRLTIEQRNSMHQRIAMAEYTLKQLQTQYDQYAPVGGGTAEQQAQIDQFNQYVQDELKRQGIPIPDAASVQNNPAYQAAIDAMKQGKSIEDAAALFRQNLPNNYNFQIGDAKFTPNKGTIGDVTQTNLPDIQHGEQINVGGTMVNRTDLEKLLSGDNNLANKASGAALDQLMQTLKDGGALTPEQMKQLTDPFIQDSLARQGGAERNALGALSARGFGTNAAAVTGSLSEIGRQYETERAQKQADIIKENLMAGIEGKQKATQGLADLAASERQARINAAQIGSQENIAQAKLTQEEQLKQADLKFAQDELFQNGQLSQAGLALKQNLETYGLQLDKYKTDQGFDLEMAKQDLTQRLAQSGLDVDAAKLQADNVFKSLDAAIADKKIDSEVNTAIADLQQKAASGDRDAQFKVDSLRVEQDLRQQGLSHDLAMFTADLQYRIMSGREKLDAEMFMFLKDLDFRMKQANKGGGLGGFLGKIIGNVVSNVTSGTIFGDPASFQNAASAVV